MHNSGLARRLGAIIYDNLLVLAILFLVTLPFIAMRSGEPVEPGEALYRLVLFLAVYLFYVGYWTLPGHTLGMQAWRLKIETNSGEKPDLKQASMRFFAAILSLLPAGLGFWWQLWDKDGLAWHDRLSGTRLRYYPKD